ncbi:hypothetical protein LPC10_00980 [Methylorubrum sp. B1-46]|uniref:hypothetical protein n=1 Tax=Methylorubrum sp. B1-46 TaxID=2897334 RepID=UPI0007C97F5D|nr:hypothetical protein [Methylorubrum sp. B1-46]OAH22449.1 hypothetical protein AX289_27175 [Methylorubrum populi]UGB26230.1 hypothetical protein LPC10_00980 [Methylorubrum sp. B1-46]
MRRGRAKPLTACAILAAVSVAPTAAEGWGAARFDPPKTIETATDAQGRQITCTVYPDLVIRESDTDTPAPEDAALIPIRGGPPVACRAVPGPSARRLETGGQRFLGRADGFLVFEDASTNGTMPFAVIDAATGRRLFTDTSTYDGIDRFAVEGGVLRLGFRRGVQGACSIPQQGAACWARIVREEKLPPPVAALPGPAKACAEAYRVGKAPKDTQSIVSFPVRLVWTGSLMVEADGPVRCLPTP